VQKTGTDTSYQGSVQGQITITNPQNVPVNIYAINDYVQGGPKSTVSCGAPVPFQVRGRGICDKCTLYSILASQHLHVCLSA
jgi:hypothetical protein